MSSGSVLVDGDRVENLLGDTDELHGLTDVRNFDGSWVEYTFLVAVPVQR